MACSELTGRKTTAQPDPGAEYVDAFSVEEFCRRHRISVQLFYKLRPQMPATFKVGSRVLVSREAAAAWRRKRELIAQRTQALGTQRQRFSPEEFCYRQNMSLSYYRKLRAQGKGPKEDTDGQISLLSEADFMRARAAEAEAEVKATTESESAA